MSSDPVAAISSLISFWPQIIKLKSASFHSALLHCLPVYKAICLHQKCYRRKTTKQSQLWAIFPVLHRFQNCYKTCQHCTYLIVENNPNTENPCCYFVTPCTKKLLYSTTGSSLPSLPSPPSFIFFLNFLPSLPFSPSLLFIHLASLLVLSVCQTLLSFSLSNRKRHLPLKKHPSVKYLSLACSSGQQLLLEPTSYLDKPGNS